MSRSLTLFLFYAAKVLANLAVYAFIPLLPLYLDSQQASPVQIGIFFSCMALARLVMGLIGGWLADSVGHLRSLVMGSLSGLFAFLAILWAPSWQWALLGMFLINVAASLTTPSQAAFIAGFVTERRGRAFAVMNTIQSLALVLGPTVGGWLVERQGFDGLLWFSSALYGLAILIRFSLMRDAPAQAAGQVREGFRASLRGMRSLIVGGGLLAVMLMTDGFHDISASLTETYQPLFLSHAGLAVGQIGLVASIAALTTLLSHTLSGWLVDRRGEKTPMFLSAALAGVGISVFLLARSFAGYALAWGLYGLTEGLAVTAFDSLISKAVPPARRGMAYGLFSTAQGLFSLPVPILGGWLYTISPAAPMIGAALTAVMSVFVIWSRFPGGHLADYTEAADTEETPGRLEAEAAPA